MHSPTFVLLCRSVIAVAAVIPMVTPDGKASVQPAQSLSIFPTTLTHTDPIAKDLFALDLLARAA